MLLSVSEIFSGCKGLLVMVSERLCVLVSVSEC